MIPDRIAVISDIHGNAWALDAVLNDVSEREVGYIVNLGDSVYGPLKPARVADMLISRGIATIRGNEDRLIIEREATGSQASTIQFVRQQLSDDQLQWLKSLPITAEHGDELFLCHGTPHDDTAYLLRKVSASGVVRRSAEELEDILAHIESAVILCGHDHAQADIRLPSGRMILNPGSVGLPAFSDELPLPHEIAVGSPHARYSILGRSADGWSAEHCVVEYDWDQAADMAVRHGRADWAHWLRTGLAA
jgi:putative phosphoesterase